MKPGIIVGVVGLCLGAAGVSSAGVVFQQLPDYSTGYLADSSGNYPNQRMAENFKLTSAAAISMVEVWGEYYPNNIPSDHFTVSFYASAGMIPGALLYTGAAASFVTVDTGVDTSERDVYQSTITLATPFNAAAGTQYWICIDNATGLGSSWAWITTDESDFKCAFSVDAANSWSSFDESLSLRLYDVPAPSTLAMLGIGGMIAARRGRR